MHSDLYEVINQVITRVLPMWGATLKSLRRGLEPRITYNGPQYELDPRKCDPRASFKEVGPQQRDRENEYEYEMRRHQWEVKNGRLVVPEPERFVPPQDCTIPSLGREFRSLQIIVKLANIQLTPEKPEYSGGLWHVEGQLVCLFQSGFPVYLLFLRTNTSAPRLYILTLVIISPLPSWLLANKATPGICFGMKTRRRTTIG